MGTGNPAMAVANRHDRGTLGHPDDLDLCPRTGAPQTDALEARGYVTHLICTLCLVDFCSGECYIVSLYTYTLFRRTNWSQIAKSMGPTRGPPGFCRSQMGPMLAPWTMLSGYWHVTEHIVYRYIANREDTTTHQCSKKFYIEIIKTNHLRYFLSLSLAYRLFGVKPLLNQCWLIVKWIP